MELPRELAPWAAYLDLFPPEMAAALGPLVRRLDLAIGPLRRHRASGDGDPDGFDGVARRGTYERLMLSEWLLAEEVPEEFTRRAATGEHAFLHLARREPGAALQSAVLLDAGPDQWGMPRVAHLAALIVLARRAEAAGARFQWAALQQREERPHVGLTEASIRGLLEARAAFPPSNTLLDRWRERLEFTEPRPDLWIVSGSRPAKSLETAGASMLLIDDPCLPETTALNVTIAEAGRGARAVTLPLPEGPVAARLLRDPFAVAATTPRRMSAGCAPMSNLVFTSTGNKLLAMADYETIVSYPIPNSPRAQAGRPRRHSSRGGGAIMSAGRMNRGVVGVAADFDEEEGDTYRIALSFEWIAGGDPAWADGAPFMRYVSTFDEWPDMWLAPLYALFTDSAHGARMATLLEDRLIWLQPTYDQQRRLCASGGVIAQGVKAIAPVGDGLAYVVERARRWQVRRVDRNGNVVDPTGREVSSVMGEAWRSARFGFGGECAHPEYGLVAVEGLDGRWTILDATGESHFAAPAGTRAIGVIGTAAGPGLVVIEGDGRRITVLGKNWTYGLPRTSSEIEQASVSPVSPYIAYSTAGGDLFVHSVEHKAHLLRLTVEASA